MTPPDARPTPETFTLSNGRAEWRGRAASLADAIRRADRARFDLRGLVLPGAGLDGAALNMLSLHGAVLSGATLSHADLVATDLIGADLSVTSFLCANLADGDLSGAGAGGANFEGANLHGTRLVGADLERANVRLAVMTGTDLTGTNLSGVTGLSLAQLREADTGAIREDLMAWLSSVRGLDGRLGVALTSGAGVTVTAPGAVRPVGQWLRRLSPGVPVTDPVAALTLEWIREWQAGR